MKELFVRRVYSSYGIDIVVEIDYVKKIVSLTDKDGNPKEYIFNGRTPEYLNGWRAILKAMEYAVNEAQQELKALDAKELDDFVRLYQKLDKALKKDEGNPDVRTAAISR